VNEFLLVFGIAALASLLTYLGAPVAERFDVPNRVVSGALQLAAGLLVALVGLSLLPPAVRAGSPMQMTLAFFCGGALFVLFEYFSSKKLAASSGMDANTISVGLFVGVLTDMTIDGVMIGLGSTLTLATGLLLALSLGISAAPMAFVAIATAKRQGVSKERRRLLSFMFFLCVLSGAMLGFLVLRNQSLALRLILVALASGFLITMVTQSIIPEANREGEPSLAGILFTGGIALYALFSLLLQ
jgi:zinc transporter, ZIP family